MKKILLALIFISSFAFSAPTYIAYNSNQYIVGVPLSATVSYLNIDSLFTKISTNVYLVGQSGSELSVFIVDNTNYVPYYNGACNGCWGNFSSGRSYLYYLSNTCELPLQIINGECILPVPTCTTNQYLENNVCIDNPTCQLGTTLNTSTHTCTDDFPITNTEYLVGGGVLLTYADNKMMLLRRDGSAESWDLETGDYYFPNRPFDGVVPPSASYNPLSFNPSTPIEYKELGFGDFVAFKFNQAGIALASAGLWTLGAPAMVPIYALNSVKQTPDETLKQTPTSVTVSQTTLDSIDFSEYENTATSTPQTIPNTQITVQKVPTAYDPNNPNFWAGAGHSKGFVAGGDVVATSPTNPNTALVTSPTEVKLVQLNADGSINETIFDKQNLKDTATTGSELTVKQVTIQPSKLSNDGTYSATQETTQSTINPATNQTTPEQRISDIPAVIDYNPRTGLKDGNLYSSTTGAVVGTAPTGTTPGSPGPAVAPITPAPAGGTGSVDLSGLTGRLDKINNSLTSLNNKFSQTETPSATPNVENPIDNSKTDGIFESFKAAWNTAKGDIDTLSSAISNGKDTVSGGFSLNLSTGYIETCPYTTNLDFGAGHTYEIPIDFCKVLSPLKPILSIFFNILFQLMIITFSFKSFVRLV